MSGIRNRRVADRILHELASLVQSGLADRRVGFVTLTDVRLSPDLRHAQVFVSVLEGDPEEPVAALNHAVPFLRRELARRSGLRFTPSLRFVRDDVAESGQRLEELFQTIRRPKDAPDTNGDLGE